MVPCGGQHLRSIVRSAWGLYTIFSPPVLSQWSLSRSSFLCGLRGRVALAALPLVGRTARDKKAAMGNGWIKPEGKKAEKLRKS